MAYIPDSPATETVPVPTPRALNNFSIDSITINLVQNQPAMTSMHVVWFEGYEDGGVFVPATRHEADLSGSDFLTAMNATVTPGASHYDDFRSAVWAYLASHGFIPSGTVV